MYSVILYCIYSFTSFWYSIEEPVVEIFRNVSKEMEKLIVSFSKHIVNHAEKKDI